MVMNCLRPFDLLPSPIRVTEVKFVKTGNDSTFVFYGKLMASVSSGDTLVAIENVFVKNKQTMAETFSDSSGIFKLENVHLSDTVWFSLIGYERKEIVTKHIFNQ